VNQGDTVTLTATAAPTVSQQSPSGTVSFYDNGTLLQTEDVSSGTATVTLSSLPVGANSITAAYSGDANFNAATASVPVSVAVAALPPGFTMASPWPATLTITAGQTGTANVVLTGNLTFNGSVALTCSGAPSKADCSVVPASVTLSGPRTANAAVVITTTASTLTQSAVERPAFPWMKGAEGVSLAGLSLFLWPGRARRVRNLWMVLVLLAGGTVATLSMTGCGGISTTTVPGTPTGAATITVTATSGSITQSQTISVTIQ